MSVMPFPSITEFLFDAPLYAEYLLSERTLIFHFFMRVRNAMSTVTALFATNLPRSKCEEYI